MQGTTPSPNPQEPGLNKIPTTQMRDARKNMKAWRTPLKYTITEDDLEMIAQMVQDHTSKYFENVVHHRERIQEDLVDMQQLLKNIEEAQAAGNNIGAGPSTSHTGEEPKSSE
jgi:transcription initiation factor IIF auxiliary subunit